MALRLAGEEFSVVQGLDGLGWTREVEANDADPGLKITQNGSGPDLQFQQGATISTTSGDLTLSPAGVVVIPVGVEGTPSLSFTGDPDNGIYRVGSNQWGLVAGGGRKILLTGSDVLIEVATRFQDAKGLQTNTAVDDYFYLEAYDTTGAVRREAIRIANTVTTSAKLGFFGATPVVQQAGVAVTAAGIHAALVNLGLITA